MKNLSQAWLSFVAAWLVTISASSAVLAADQVVYFHPDEQGSAVAAYSESGTLCWRQTYTPYGEKIDPLDGMPSTGCGLLGGERGFTSHVQDPLIGNSEGLVYMQQRYYDPSMMRFLSVDPMGINPEDPRTLNRYSYAANNPYR